MELQNKSYKHWIVLLLCCGLMVGGLGIPLNAGGVFFSPVSQSLGVLRGTFSIHMTLTMLTVAGTTLFVPALVKRFRFKSLLTMGVVLTVLPNILMGFARSMTAFYILGSIRGIGAGMVAPILLTMIVNEWFVEHHGLVTSIIFSFTGVAGAVFSPFFSYLIGIIGWKNSYIVMGLIMLALSLPAVLYPFSLDPRKMGLLPYGYTTATDKGEAAGTKARTVPNIKLSVFLLIFSFGVLNTLVTGIPQHFPGFAETIQYSLATGGMMLSVAMIGNIFFKLLIGFLSDRIGPVHASCSMIVVNLFSIILLLSAANELVLIVGSFLFGSIYSVSAVGVLLITKEFFGNENFDKVYPTISVALSIGGALALPLVGFVYDFTNSYTPAFFLAVVLNVLNSVFVFAAARKARTTQINVLEN